VFSDDFVKGAVGLKKFQGIKYNTVARNITGLIPPGSTGINHGELTKFTFIRVTLCSSGLAIGIGTDGIVVLLTVTIS
jgi:hypothetical protein